MCFLQVTGGQDATEMVGRVDYFISSKSILTLTGLFFSLFALTATQDIAVDGWAVTLLSPRIRGHSSTCQSIGAFGFGMRLQHECLHSDACSVHFDRCVIFF